VIINRRLRVLISAYACNPYQGSEKGVGWGWVSAIARHHEVWVLTDEINKGDIEKKNAEDYKRYKNIHFHYVPRTRLLRLEKIWPPSYLWTYQMWQRDAYKLAVELHKEIGFDLAHQLTYVGFRNPGFLWKMNIPFVWGPIGGLENTPWLFLPTLGFNGFVYYAARNIINSLQRRFLLLPKKAFKKAGENIIAATEGIRKEILKWYGYESEVICEIGPPEEIAADHSFRKPGGPLLIAWSGLHDPAKALPLLLNAAAKLPQGINWQLDILGKGPCTKKWQRLATKLGVDERCRWHGWLPRNESLNIMRKAHIFVITSLKDLTSTVLLEALSLGIPVICPDHCGFKNVVTEQCGIKVPVGKPLQMVSDIAAAIRYFADNEDKRILTAKGALKRIEDFSWAKKSELVDIIYRKAITMHQ
jgi:glycosyltransferase involved in cell wall biosynthesis